VGPHYVVFSSSPDARADVVAWDAHALRFFATRLGVLGDLDAPELRVHVTPPRGEPGERLLASRPRAAEDLALADLAEQRAGGGGLVLVARRCQRVWLVGRREGDDPLALRLSMALASIHLGPVLDARGPDLFGVKTAREKLERLESQS
jgi:hypothetical protein